MPRLRMDRQVRMQLQRLPVSAKMTMVRFCSEHDVIVEVETEDEAHALTAAVALLGLTGRFERIS